MTWKEFKKKWEGRSGLELKVGMALKDKDKELIFDMDDRRRQ